MQVARRSDDEHRYVFDEHGRVSFLTGIKEQLLIVSVAGAFQTGRSSFISHLTGDASITVGSGSQETTAGIWMHGPYDLNVLKKRWNTPEVDGDTTKVLFIDTEGFPYGAGSTNEEGGTSLAELIGPFLAISQVCIFMHPPHLSERTLEAFRDLLDMVGNICCGANSGQYGDGNMKIIDISTNLGRFTTGEMDEYGDQIVVTYKPEDSSNFAKASAFLKRVQSPRLCRNGSQLFVDEFWPLPVYECVKTIDEQSESFQCGFRLVCQNLFQILDEIKKKHMITGEKALEALIAFQAEMKSGKLGDLARRVREKAERGSAESLLKPFVDATVAACKAEITLLEQSFQDRIARSCRTLTKDELGIQSKVDEAMMRLEGFGGVSESAKKSPSWLATVKSAECELCCFAREKMKAYMDLLEAKQKQVIMARLGAALNEELLMGNEMIFKECETEKVQGGVTLAAVSEKMRLALEAELKKVQEDFLPLEAIFWECKEKALMDAHTMISKICAQYATNKSQRP